MKTRVLKLAAALTAVACLAACTVISTATIPPHGPQTPFITTGGINQPYDSLGIVQITRKGVLLFGLIEAPDVSLQTGIAEELIPLVRSMGGSGAINVRFHVSQYLPLTRVIGFIFFIFPLPTHVLVTAEVVRLLPAQPPAPGFGAPPPAAPAPQ